jgi:DNA-binding GntR family transcriptional regulator
MGQRPVEGEVQVPGSSRATTPPETIVDYITEQIRRRIVLGKLTPGERVPVYALAEEFGISRVPLREAVRQLEAEGLLDNLPRRGAIVRKLNRQDLEDAFRVLNDIEILAVERATQAADASVIAEMRYWSERMHGLGEDSVSEEMLEAHRAFHFALFEAAGDGILLRHLKMLWHTCQRYVMYGMPDPERQESSQDEHLQLIDLVEAKNSAGATKLLEHHLQNSLEFAVTKLEESGADPS